MNQWTLNQGNRRFVAFWTGFRTGALWGGVVGSAGLLALAAYLFLMRGWQ